MPAGHAHVRHPGARTLRVGVDEKTQGLAYREPERRRDQGYGGRRSPRRSPAASSAIDASATRSSSWYPSRPTRRSRRGGRRPSTSPSSAVSMSCGRWQDVAFSTEYLTTDQQFLVRADSPIDTAADLDGRTVCVTAGSTSSEHPREHAPLAERLEVEHPHRVPRRPAAGQADAYFGHETFLYGMVLQDPTMTDPPGVLPPDVTTSHYGIAVSHDDHEFVRFVNQRPRGDARPTEPGTGSTTTSRPTSDPDRRSRRLALPSPRTSRRSHEPVPLSTPTSPGSRSARRADHTNLLELEQHPQGACSTPPPLRGDQRRGGRRLDGAGRALPLVTSCSGRARAGHEVARHPPLGVIRRPERGVGVRAPRAVDRAVRHDGPARGARLLGRPRSSSAARPMS